MDGSAIYGIVQLPLNVVEKPHPVRGILDSGVLMLQVFFGEDEHTAADGPYTRLMKTRKWLYLSSGAALLLSQDYVRTPAINRLLQVVDISSYFLGAAILGGLVYLLFQYLLLCTQLFSIYDIVLTERFRFRREEELTTSRSKISINKKKLRDIQTIISDDLTLLDLATKQRIIEKDLAMSNFQVTAQDINVRYGDQNEEQRNGHIEALKKEQSKVNAMNIELTNIQNLKGSRLQELDEEHSISGAEDELRESQKSYELLARQNPADREVYRRSELMIDASRLIPAAVLPAIALCSLVSHLPNMNKMNDAQQVANATATKQKQATTRQALNPIKIKR